MKVVQLNPENIPIDAFVRCPKQPGWDFVQVRSQCAQCAFLAGFVEDDSVSPPLFGSHCAYPIARWWKRIPILKE